MKTPELDSSAEGGSLDPLVRALLAEVRNLIYAEQPLCSGYRVFPDGTKCKGCADCSPNDGDKPPLP